MMPFEELSSRLSGRAAVDRANRTGEQVGRRPLIAIAGIGVLVVLGLAAFLYDHNRRERIAPGVRVAGIDVGGLSADAAALRLRDRVEAPLQQDVVVSAAGRDLRLNPRDAGVQVDTRGMVDAALHASRGGWFVSRAIRDLTGSRVNRSIGATVTYSHAAVRQMVARVAGVVNRPARDATVVASTSGLHPVRERAGVVVNATLLARRIELALSQPAALHRVVAPTRTVYPKVTESRLATRYPAYIVVDRTHFRLLFFQHLKHVDTYPISVGRQGLETPAGLYDVQWKQVDPPWHVPNDSWAGALAGRTIPPGPQDPIKARWMAFNGGAGIHGTDEVASIGHAASHGCVRMRIPDVISLYSRSPVGTPVYVV
jgi:lipoprotein-anchoring transpeptidase ErfK/SrfK